MASIPAASRSPTCGHAGQQPVALDRVQHGERRRAGHRVAAERAAVIALAQRRCRTAPEADAGADGQAAAEPLGQRDHVRDDALALVREPLAGPADAALDLVEHQQRAGLVARRAGRLQVAGRRRHDAALAQARLQEDRGAVRRRPPRSARRCRRRGRTERQPRTARTAPGCEFLPVRPARPWSGRGSCARRRRSPAAPAPARRRTSLIAASFASVPELAKNTRPSMPSRPEQPLGQHDLPLVQVQVRGVRQPADLLGDGRDHAPGARARAR